MTLYARQIDGAWRLIRPGQVVWFEDARTAHWGIWPDAEKIEKGIFPAAYVDEAPSQHHTPAKELFDRVGDRVEIRREWTAPDLEDMREDALWSIESERLRCQALAASGDKSGDPPSPEKLALYARKALWAATGSLGLLASEAAAMGLSTEALRDVILAKAASADAKIAAIEAARTAALARIKAASDLETIEDELEAGLAAMRGVL